MSMKMTMAEFVGLEPCPFCKGESFYNPEYNGGCVECRECGAEGPYKRTEAEAIAAWNSRAERTCRNVSTTNNFRCSECDAADLDFDKPSYCHGCGAKVVGV